MGRGCAPRQVELRSPACLWLIEGTRRAVNLGRFFLGYLLLAKQKKVTSCRATPPAKLLYPQRKQNMQTTIEILGKPVLVEWSASADKKLQELTEPLSVEMELYFSCLIRKAVRFGRDAHAAEFSSVSP